MNTPIVIEFSDDLRCTITSTVAGDPDANFILTDTDCVNDMDLPEPAILNIRMALASRGLWLPFYGIADLTGGNANVRY